MTDIQKLLCDLEKRDWYVLSLAIQRLSSLPDESKTPHVVNWVAGKLTHDHICVRMAAFRFFLHLPQSCLTKEIAFQVRNAVLRVFDSPVEPVSDRPHRCSRDDCALRNERRYMNTQSRWVAIQVARRLLPDARIAQGIVDCLSLSSCVCCEALRYIRDDPTFFHPPRSLSLLETIAAKQYHACLNIQNMALEACRVHVRRRFWWQMHKPIQLSGGRTLER